MSSRMMDHHSFSTPISKLNLRLEHCPYKNQIHRLYKALADQGFVYFKPRLYLSDEWFCPDRTAAIAMPFYLANPELLQLCRDIHPSLEGATLSSFSKYLRHECGHAFDHAYGISGRRDFPKIFGDPRLPYDPESFLPRHAHPDYVENINRWYAQTHPLEDFAETFAVWLNFRGVKYKTSKRLSHRLSMKFEYLDKMHDLFALRPMKFNHPRNMNPLYRLNRNIGQMLNSYQNLQSTQTCRANLNLQRY